MAKKPMSQGPGTVENLANWTRSVRAIETVMALDGSPGVADVIAALAAANSACAEPAYD